MGRQRWTNSPRSPPYFDTRPRVRPPLLDEFYAMSANTLSVNHTSTRRYAAVFHSKLPARPLLKSDSDLGPGSYDVNFDCTCGGIRTEDRPSPSRMFAPRVGGKF